jgi:hypothetical protein
VLNEICWAYHPPIADRPTKMRNCRVFFISQTVKHFAQQLNSFLVLHNLRGRLHVSDSDYESP